MCETVESFCYGEWGVCGPWEKIIKSAMFSLLVIAMQGRPNRSDQGQMDSPQVATFLARHDRG